MTDYFTLAELRALPQMSDTTRYTNARCELAAAYIVGVIEREVGTSFVARTVTDEVHDGGVYSLVLRRPFVLSVTSATESAVAVTDTLSVQAGVVEKYATGATSPTMWESGRRNVKVTYQAGYTALADIPGDIKEAALQGTRARLLDTDSLAAVADRRTSVTSDAGVISFVIAGEKRPTGYPEVDAVILGWKARLDNFGFA